MDAAIRWSPHSTPERPHFLIVDVLGTRLRLCQVDSVQDKKVKPRPLCMRDKLPNYTAFDWSKTSPYHVAIGAASGEANLVQIDPERSPKDDYIWSFGIKHQRKCNSIAFSTKNFLATGLDRVRNDFCMNIYDLNLPNPASQEPYKKLAVSEAISSIKFFATQPDTLVAGVFRQCVRLYDLRGMVLDPRWKMR
jgi:WD repeat-containing protein mio